MTAPEYFSSEEAAIWAAFVEAMPPGAPTLTATTLQILEAYCGERARWLDAEKYLRENGSTIVLRSDKGEVKSTAQAPQLAIARVAQQRALKLFATLQRYTRPMTGAR